VRHTWESHLNEAQIRVIEEVMQCQ
jgi:hypothetical protein